MIISVRHPISKTVMEKIIEGRKENGSFNKISDILNIKGIGVQTLQNVCNAMLHKSDFTKPTVSKPKRKIGQIIHPQLLDIEVYYIQYNDYNHIKID